MSELVAIPIEQFMGETSSLPAYTDEALALRFAVLHEDLLRYVATWSRWLHWTGTRWQPDETLLAFDLARKVCREAAGECNDTKVASVLASVRTVAAVERLARSDRRLAAKSDQWDKDLWLTNTPAGTIDLRTSTMRPHSPLDFITKVTAASPEGTCPA